MPAPRWRCGFPNPARTSSIRSPMLFRSFFADSRSTATRSGSSLTSNRSFDVSVERAGLACLDRFLRFGMKVPRNRSYLVVGNAVFHPRVIRRRDLHGAERDNSIPAHDSDFLPIQRQFQEGGKPGSGFGGRECLHGLSSKAEIGTKQLRSCRRSWRVLPTFAGNFCRPSANGV